MSDTRLEHPFDAIVDEHSRVLILGSFPSIKSFEQNFYYAHPRNQFWPIMEELFGVTLTTNEEKRAFALSQGIALWDTYGSLIRESGNSSDSNLKALQPNDLRAFLKRYPNISHLFFTGQKAFQGYMKHFKDIPIKTTLLPSTSPAHAAMKKEEKLRHYRAIKDALE
jgi:TDG/mug DNA glycosylase family protein